MTTRLHHDFETYSEVDLKKVGTSRYARHPSTQPMMCAYAFNDDPVKQWLPEEGEAMPAELREGMEDPAVIKYAWNKPFEWNIWTHVLGIRTPHSSWRDPMVLAFSLSLPGSLERAGDVVGLPYDKAKIKDGRRLIKIFCTPAAFTQKRKYYRRGPHTDPKEWEEFKRYNRQDVEAERAIYKLCRQWNLPKHEWELWYLDQEINEAGIPINMNVVHNAIDVAHQLVSKKLYELSELTGLDNPNSNMQLLPWLQDNGYAFEDLKKGHIDRALEKETEPRMKRIYELRQEVSKASVKKYTALANTTDDDGLAPVHSPIRRGRADVALGRSDVSASEPRTARSVAREDPGGRGTRFGVTRRRVHRMALSEAHGPSLDVRAARRAGSRRLCAG